MSFARKAVHWTKDDVKAAAAVLRFYDWNLDKSLEGFRGIPQFVREAIVRPGIGFSVIQKALLDALDWDFSAIQSILIFVHEFRSLIEEAQQEEGAADAGSEPKADGSDPDRG